VSGGIVRTEIGFDLDDAASEEFAAVAADKDFTQQTSADEAGIAVVKGAWEGTLKRFHAKF